MSGCKKISVKFGLSSSPFQPLSPQMSSTFLDVYLPDGVINIQCGSEGKICLKHGWKTSQPLELNEFGAAEPETTVQACVSTFGSVKPLDNPWKRGRRGQKLNLNLQVIQEMIENWFRERSEAAMLQKLPKFPRFQTLEPTTTSRAARFRPRPRSLSRPAVSKPPEDRSWSQLARWPGFSFDADL